MTKLPAFLIAILICMSVQNVQAQSFTFTIASPSANSISDSILDINVKYYTSTYELLRITAVSEGRTLTLTNAGSGGGYYNFNGSINIASFTEGGIYKLKVTCRDVLGNEQTDSVNYKYVRPLRADLISPLSYATTYPSLRIKTSHSGYDTCTSTVNVIVSSQTVFSYTSVLNDIDTTITLNSNISGSGMVSLTITDRWGQTAQTQVSVTAENYLKYLYLTPVYTGQGNILDYNRDKILEATNTALYIVDSGFQTSSRIPGSYTVPSYGALITPNGAIWSGYEWLNGTLNTTSYKSYSGNYALYVTPWIDTFTWITEYSLFRKDLATRQNLEISHRYSEPDNNSAAVDNNGAILLYAGANSVLSKYYNGVTTYIGEANIPYGFSNVKTYGDTIMYSIVNYENYNTTINIKGGPVAITQGLGSTTSFSLYEAAGKYIAYVKPGTTGQQQVWVRDSTGNSTQRTFFGTSSGVMAINALGDLMFSNGNKFYYLPKDSMNAKDLGTFMGKPFYKDNTWYLIYKNSLYKVNINAYRTIAAGNWSSPASWQNGSVPLPGADVIVDTNIIVDSNATCNTLRVIPPGSITVLPGVNLTVLY